MDGSCIEFTHDFFASIQFILQAFRAFGEQTTFASDFFENLIREFGNRRELPQTIHQGSVCYGIEIAWFALVGGQGFPTQEHRLHTPFAERHRT
ncbi:hypothetical protein CDAR_528341 [Caerostris darwini]|uniref:Uncharacterized protein n=1 Tax=Caerostris darwini TaxID=1538125 RepID=A0AAV4P6J4_9ARAC|nr:hypothetical protein CDAR_528341 [Caerostris darwini]